MKKLLNNLYITTDGSYLHKERETLVIKQDREKVFQLPLHTLNNLFCYGRIMVSPGLLAACGEQGIGISFFTGYGKFQSRLQGPQSGNVLLRRAQYRLADDAPHTLAKLFVAAKVANARQILMKHQRNHRKSEALETVVTHLVSSTRSLEKENDVDQIRGIEGDAAARYFAVFNELIVEDQRANFQFNGRT